MGYRSDVKIAVRSKDYEEQLKNKFEILEYAEKEEQKGFTVLSFNCIKWRGDDVDLFETALYNLDYYEEVQVGEDGLREYNENNSIWLLETRTEIIVNWEKI